MKHLTVFGLVILLFSLPAHSQQAWRDCTPGSIGPGGCDSIGPGGGRSIGPGGGMSIGPGGGLSIGPGGGQSIGPGGGQSIRPGGGKSIMRDRSRGLNTDTMRPYNDPYGTQPPRINQFGSGSQSNLTMRSTGHQKRPAFGSLRCAPAPVTISVKFFAAPS